MMRPRTSNATASQKAHEHRPRPPGTASISNQCRVQLSSRGLKRERERKDSCLFAWVTEPRKQLSVINWKVTHLKGVASSCGCVLTRTLTYTHTDLHSSTQPPHTAAHRTLPLYCVSFWQSSMWIIIYPHNYLIQRALITQMYRYSFIIVSLKVHFSKCKTHQLLF